MANELRNKLNALTRSGAFVYLIALAIAAVVTVVIYGVGYVFGNAVYQVLVLLAMMFNIVIFVWNVIVHSGIKWSLWYTIAVRLRDRVTGNEEKS